ncbi:MAG: cytochrome-c peroxidase [Lewinella sp.]|jgi:cytochrome c peroxidase|uniref:cytochrome-c peroxidase n=1 Tax=Lewinella sp. TaxID=2004506 RepID=UPI003D6C26D1
MKNTALRSFCLLILAFGFTACLNDEVKIDVQHYSEEELQEIQQYLNLPAYRDAYQVDLAPHILNTGQILPSINNAKATLGRVLFYDNKLSATGETSCESCHHQELAFSDDKAFSDGINGQKTKRNSLPLAAVANFTNSYDSGPNSFGQIGFFWDERAGTIQNQSEQTISDDIEMGTDFNDLEVKLANENYYRILFRKAYGDEAVTKDRILEAIQEFVNSFVATNTRFDEGMNAMGTPGLDFPNFTIEENRGKAIFVDACGSCHAANMSTPSNIHVANNGLDVAYTDQGVGGISQQPNQFGVFKVPFLRNIELTAPYMHDGRFATLEEVIDHYSNGIQDHDNLSEALRNPDGSPRRFNFTEEEKADLVAFFKTLTDETFIQEERFSDPFQ